MSKVIKAFFILIILSVVIWGIMRWYTLVIKGNYYSTASFLGSALATLLPAAAILLLVWLAVKIYSLPNYKSTK